MTIYTVKEYMKMMEPMIEKIRSERPANWKPVDMDLAEKEFGDQSF